MTPDFKSILVPVDFSPTSLRVLDYAQTLAARYGAALHVIHVCEVPAATGSMDAYAMAYTNWNQQLGEEAERELQKVVAKLSGVAVTSEVIFGRPSHAIVDAAAANKVDLIVMGTHGHGPLMHALMGNVAERVVRTAPCPVLTVREPPNAAAVPQPSKSVMPAAVLVAALLLAPFAVTPAMAQAAVAQPMRQQVAGAAVFQTYCATCHGTSGRGDGPLASAMRRTPSDLSEIAKRNNGDFSSEMVFRIIDGKWPVRGHGGPDMPVWGDAFAPSREGSDAASVKARIDSLVAFVRSLQVKPAH